MFIKQATKSERQYIFENYVVNDFHDEATKPLKIMERLVSRGIYGCWLLCDGNETKAYAFVAWSSEVEYCILDYYAVLPELRSQGLGGIFLSLLSELFTGELGKKGIIAEVENPTFAVSDDERDNMERRIRFYERCGLLHTDVLCKLFGTEYVIMLLSREPFSRDLILCQLQKMYDILFDKPSDEKELFLR